MCRETLNDLEQPHILPRMLQHAGLHGDVDEISDEDPPEVFVAPPPYDPSAYDPDVAHWSNLLTSQLDPSAYAPPPYGSTAGWDFLHSQVTQEDPSGTFIPTPRANDFEAGGSQQEQDPPIERPQRDRRGPSRFSPSPFQRGPRGRGGRGRTDEG